MELGRDQDRLAGPKLERPAILAAFEQGRWDVGRGPGVPQVGRHCATHEQPPAAEAAQLDVMRAALSRGEPARQAHGEVVRLDALGQVAEYVQLARVDMPSGDRLAGRLLTSEELDGQAGLAVEVSHSHCGQGRQKQVDTAARFVDDLHSRKRGPKPLDRGDSGRGGDVRGSASLRAGLCRIGPDDRHRADAGRRERQNAVVGQQHERLGCGAANQRGSRRVGEVPGLRGIERRAAVGAWPGGRALGALDPIRGQRSDARREKQHPARLVVQDRFAHLAPPNRPRQHRAEEVGGPGHLQV